MQRQEVKKQTKGKEEEGIEESADGVKKRGDNWNNVTSSSKNGSSSTHSAFTAALCKCLIDNRLHIFFKH